MPYQIRWQATVCWVGDGTGQMSVPSAQSIKYSTELGGAGGQIQVPGGDAPSQANFNTAAQALATNLGTSIAANLAQIQAFATGGN